MRRPIALSLALVLVPACAGSDDTVAPRLHAVGEGELAIVVNDLPACASDVVVSDAASRALTLDLAASGRAVLSGLAPSTTYTYAIAGCGAGARGAFTTPPRHARHASSTTRFAVFADSQNNPGIVRAIASRIAASRPDFAIGAGDFVQEPDDPDAWREQVVQGLAPLGADVPLFVARGNHDGEGALADAHLVAPGRFYAATWGPVRLVVLDTNLPLERGSEQRAWLAEELASRRFRGATWRVVVQHEPLFAEGWEGGPYEPRASFEGLDALYAEAGVHVVFQGHAHDYERGARAGVTYVIAGGAGGELDTQQQDLPEIERYEPRHHHVDVEAAEGALTLRAVDAFSGVVFDEVVIPR